MKMILPEEEVLPVCRFQKAANQKRLLTSNPPMTFSRAVLLPAAGDRDVTGEGQTVSLCHLCSKGL